jgi:hypothetical protein
VLVSSGSLSCARDVARWREWLAVNAPDRPVVHVLNRHGAPDALPDHEFTRAAGQAADIRIPYDRDIASASILGIKGTQKCGALRRGLAPLVRQLSGERMASQRSLLSRWWR